MKKFRIKETRIELNDGTTEIQYEIQERRFLRWKTLNLWYRTSIDDHKSQRLCIFEDEKIAEKLLAGLEKSYSKPFGESVSAFPVWNTSNLSKNAEYYEVLYYCFEREVTLVNNYFHLSLHTWDELIYLLGKLPKISKVKKFFNKLVNLLSKKRL